MVNLFELYDDARTCQRQIHFRIQKRSEYLPILGQVNPFPTTPSQLLKKHCNIIPSSTLSSYKWTLSLRVHHQNPKCTSPVSHTCYMPCSSHYSRFDHLNNIWWAVQVMKLLTGLSPSLPWTASPLGANVFLGTLFSKTLKPSLLYCSNSCTSLHFKTLKSHTKTLKILPYMFRSPLKPSSGGPWPYFATLLNGNVDLHLL